MKTPVWRDNGTDDDAPKEVYERIKIRQDGGGM
jgi:hypothetical protein